MAEESGFRGMLELLGDLGVYDVILPFLLVFTLIFAILEKTKILGVDKIEGREYTKKNLNSIVSFVVAFLAIASAQIVAVINQVMANVVLLLILGICFLMLVGVFMGDKEFTLEAYPKWVKFFMVVMFIAILAIFLNSLTVTTDAGETFTWLEVALSVFTFWNEAWAAGILFAIGLIIILWFITKDPKMKEHKEKKENGG